MSTAAALPLAVSSARLVQNWKQAREQALSYLDALGVPPADREALSFDAIDQAARTEEWPAGADAVSETIKALRRLLMDRYPRSGLIRVGCGDAFTEWRLEMSLTGRFSGEGCQVPKGEVFTSQAKIDRRSFVPEKIERRFLRRFMRRLFLQRIDEAPLRGRALRRARGRQAWVRTARLRRIVLLLLVLLPSIVASGFMMNVLPRKGETGIEIAIVGFFAALFSWISIGFWTALFGFFTLLGRRSRFAITSTEPVPAGFRPMARTAVCMPICEEPVGRVFAGLRAIYDSLARTGCIDDFDFFVLSDSADPGLGVREEEAWADWCRDVNGFGKIFYRRRRVRLKRKSGNVADFCRRWGKKYEYMVMLDADSVMSGEALVRLVHLMEKNPDAGMIQTAPVAVNRRSLLARVQQFAGRLYGPLFAAGLHSWQLGDGQYWGHNTVIRIKPFMDHCGLPKLPGKPPLGGEILSHDFVEAALMGRSGWTIWLAYDLEGSWEEVPSTLLEEMKRDRRWCQGNLQHLRLLFSEGLFGAHRALFLNGVLSYVSALLWSTFLTLSTAEAIHISLVEPDYFPHGASLFPEWPVWRPDWAISLMTVTALILFLPKVLSIFLIIAKERSSRRYGGLIRMLASVVLEVLLSSLLAPIRMAFHSRFVLTNLLGRTVTWRSQGREDSVTTWSEAVRQHGLDTVIGAVWATALYFLNPEYFWWVTPIVGALIVSIPLSVFTSRLRFGEVARRWGLFMIPEESEMPREIAELWQNQSVSERREAKFDSAERDGFIRAVVDPQVNALRTALARGARGVRKSIGDSRNSMVERAVHEGPSSLSTRERRILLSDPTMIAELHRRVWEISDPLQSSGWGRVSG